MTVPVTVNGAAHELAAGATVADAVRDLAAGRERGVAVAVNGAVVPRTAWATTTLSPDDRIEVLTAAQGG